MLLFVAEQHDIEEKLNFHVVCYFPFFLDLSFFAKVMTVPVEKVYSRG